MANKKIIYEGKAKILYEGPDPDTIIQYFKDDATANNAEKHSIINGKGVLNNAISDYLMQKVNEIGIPCIFRRINGNNRKMKGIIRLINGDEILTTDINCRNDEE